MLENLGTPEDRSVCIVIREGLKLSPEDFQILDNALNDPRWGHVVLANELNKLGFKIGRDSLTRHRIGKCTCARNA
jgi:hypothetical protein